jgi:hypothetical protein
MSAASPHSSKVKVLIPHDPADTTLRRLGHSDRTNFDALSDIFRHNIDRMFEMRPQADWNNCSRNGRILKVLVTVGEVVWRWGHTTHQAATEQRRSKYFIFDVAQRAQPVAPRSGDVQAVHVASVHELDTDVDGLDATTCRILRSGSGSRQHMIRAFDVRFRVIFDE